MIRDNWRHLHLFISSLILRDTQIAVAFYHILFTYIFHLYLLRKQRERSRCDKKNHERFYFRNERNDQTKLKQTKVLGNLLFILYVASVEFICSSGKNVLSSVVYIVIGYLCKCQVPLLCLVEVNRYTSYTCAQKRGHV